MMKRVAVALLLVVGSAVHADSWPPATKEIYHSQDGRARLTVIPRDLESPFSYFGDKVDGREPAGAPAGATEKTAVARLEQRAASGRWVTLMTKPLVNEVAPVDVVVPNGAESFATFDNWHSMGHGSNAIVIYRGDGTVVRALGLDDIFPNWFVAALPHSTSSIDWRDEPRISPDGSKVIVPIVQPTTNALARSDRKTLDLAIQLDSGDPVGLQSTEWTKALSQAAKIAKETCAAERDAIRKWNAPVSAPTSANEEEWHYYLRETQYRTKWSADDAPTAGTTVLRLPTASDFHASVGWLEEALTDTAVVEHDLRAIGSPDTDRLTREIERIANGVRQGQLKGVDLVVVADARNAERIRSALLHSAASLTIIDPGQSFPQVQQRISDEADLKVCETPERGGRHGSLRYALPLLALTGGVFLLRGSAKHQKSPPNT